MIQREKAWTAPELASLYTHSLGAKLGYKTAIHIKYECLPDLMSRVAILSCNYLGLNGILGGCLG